jgi:hypothetical protein
MTIGLIIMAISVIWYLVQAELYYRLTRKNNPDGYEQRENNWAPNPKGRKLKSSSGKFQRGSCYWASLPFRYFLLASLSRSLPS